jgi:hypothetical protein
VEAALLGLLVNLGASDVFATGDRVNRSLFASLKATQDFIDNAIVDQRLEFLGWLHRSCFRRLPIGTVKPRLP